MPLIAMLALTACNGASNIAADACEGFIKASLKAPSTYKRQNIEIIDRPISKEAYAVAAGSSTDQPLYKFHLGQAINPAVRSLIVEYDAQNAFGVPLRSKEICEFLMGDTAANVFSGDPKQAAEGIANLNKAKALSAAMNAGSGDQLSCCLSPVRDAPRKAK